MRSGLRTIGDVVDSYLCCGCGACAYVAPDDCAMRDVPREGRRPARPESAQAQGAARGAGGGERALEACPGVGLAHPQSSAPGCIAELAADWGPVLELWEGHAADPQVRRDASSGGAATALCEHHLERRGGGGVLQTAADPDRPHLNATVFNTSAGDVRASCGSRYSPASPCDGLGMIEEASAPCVFVGKPCDAAGARMAARVRPALDRNLGLVLAVFCAGTPSTSGTLELLEELGAGGPESLTALRYRGRGWPGDVVAETAAGSFSTDYGHAWNDILQRHRPWRCYLCPDHSGEFADIALADPWHRPPDGKDPGRSLIVVRTEAGREALAGAMRDGYIEARPVPASILPLCQPNLLRVRGGVWGRVLACRLLGLPVPRYVNMPLFNAWKQLSARDKLRSLLGPLKRKAFLSRG